MFILSLSFNFLQAIYRMIYDCDEHDEYYVSKFPFDVDDNVSKHRYLYFEQIKLTSVVWIKE